jgi:hypothetical protein
MSGLEKKLKVKVKLSAKQEKEGFAKIVVYSLEAPGHKALKIDFVEDLCKLLEPLKITDHIPILSMQDIYLRKILAACGSIITTDETGRTSFIGGRQEAKDFFDLYFLSKTFMPLSEFVRRYCRQPQVESIVIWYRSYDRLAMKTGLMEIITNKQVSFLEMERHFKAEIEKIISQEL